MGFHLGDPGLPGVDDGLGQLQLQRYGDGDLSSSGCSGCRVDRAEPESRAALRTPGFPTRGRTQRVGYRLITTDDLAVLHFIRQARTLDLTLAEIKEVLDLQRCGEQTCERVTGILDAHIAGIDRKLADLRQLRRSLLAARRAAGTARRGGQDAVICRIIATAPVEPVHG